MKYRITTTETETTQSINDGDNRRRVVRDGETLGWITKWYESDAVNRTGIPRFSAKPLGLGVARRHCESYSSAVAYLVCRSEPLMGGHLRVRWREHGDYWGTATRIMPEDVESVRAELHLDDLGDVFEFRDLEHLDEVLTGNHLNFIPKAAAPTYRPVRGQDYCGYPCPVTRQRCTASNPCHDCQ